jgi:gluconolactonase
MRKLVVLALLLFAGAAIAQDMPLSQVLIDGEGWHEFKGKLPETMPVGLTSDGKGNLFASLAGSIRSAGIFKVEPGGKVDATPAGNTKTNYECLCFDREGRLHAASGFGTQIVRFDEKGQGKRLDPEIDGSVVAVSPAGKVYYVDPKKHAVFLSGKKEPVAGDVGRPSCMAFWKDGGTLVVGDSAGKHLYAFRVKEDGTLDAKEKYYTLRVRPKQPSGVKQLILDDKGRLYAATNLGVQVFDPTGRLCGVINPPVREPITAVALAGEKRDHLFVICGGKLYQRKTRAKAAWPPDAR